MQTLTVRAWLAHDTYYVENCVAHLRVRCARDQHVLYSFRDRHSLRNHLASHVAAILDVQVTHLTCERHSQPQQRLKSMPYYRKPIELSTVLLAFDDLRMMHTTLALVYSFVLATSDLMTQIRYLNTIHLDNNLFGVSFVCFSIISIQMASMHKRKECTNWCA